MQEEQDNKNEQQEKAPENNAPSTFDPASARPIGIPRWFPFLPVSVEIVLRPFFVLAVIVIAVLLILSAFKNNDEKSLKIPASQQENPKEESADE